MPAAPSLFFAFLICALFVVPGTRRVIATVLALLLWPIVLRRRFSAPASPPIEPDHSPLSLLPARIRGGIIRAGRELADAGFAPAGAWRIGDERRGVNSLCALFVNPERTIVYSVTLQQLGREFAALTRTLWTDIGDTIVITVAGSNAIRINRPGIRRHLTPSLVSPAAMLRVHRALLVKCGTRPVPLPIEADWPAWFRASYTRELKASLDAGIIQAANNSEYRLTRKGARAFTRVALWPWRDRALARDLLAEKFLLGELGLLGLLADAGASAGERPPKGVMVIDDRGESRSLHASSTAPNDERMRNAKFRAMLRDAREARRRLASSLPVQVFQTILAVGAFVLCLALHWPIWAGVLAAILVGMVLGGLVSAPRLAPAVAASVRVFLAHGVCPSCLYSLAGIQPGDDGCIACPECAAAWSRARVSAFPDFSPDASNDDPILHRAGAELLSVRGRHGPVARDHRRRPCLLVHRLLKKESSRAGPRTISRLMHARRRLAKSGLLLRLGLAVAAITIAVWLSMLADWSPVLAVLLMWFAFGMFAVLILFSGVGLTRRRIIRTMLDERLCPSCGTDLTAPTPERDGCVSCADCTSAWRLPPAHPPLAPPITPPAPARSP